MNIWLVSLFDPVPLDEPIYPRFIEIAKSANGLGHKVTHFTSTFRHTTKSHRFKETYVHLENDQYEVVLIHSMGYKKNMEPKRFIAHLDFAKKLIHEMNKREKPDIVFMSMPPLSTADLVTNWGKENKVPVVLDIIDPWPDSFIKDVPNSLKPIAKVFLAPFYVKLKNSFQKAAAITAISNGYLNWAKPFHDPDKLTRAFFLAISFKEVQRGLKKNEDRSDSLRPLQMIYAGSLASSYDIPTILYAAKLLNEKYPGQTKFVFTGNGSQLALIEEAKENIPNIEYLGYVSKDELIKQYGLADLGLIQHKNNLTQTITYKFFNYMSAGLPLLNSLQSEMATMIDEFQLGLNNEAQNGDQLVRNIEQYLNDPELLRTHKNNALHFTEKYGDVENVYVELVGFLKDVSTNCNVKKG